MAIVIRDATELDVDFFYEQLADLRGSVLVSREEFVKYFFESLKNQLLKQILILYNEEPAGLATINKVAAPRYAGWYYICEEMVIAEKFRTKGIVFHLLQAIIDECKKDKEAIKLIGIYDGVEVSKIYRRFFKHEDRFYFHFFLNPR